METMATWFGYRKPDPRQQIRKTKRLMEANIRTLARVEHALKKEEKGFINLIKKESRDLTDSNLKNVARESLHKSALEVMRTRKRIDHTATCKAALEFVKNGLELDDTVHKAENALAAAINAMRTANPTKNSADIAQAMQIAHKMATEQLKAEVIEGMLLDTLPEITGIDAEDSSIDQLLSEILDDSLATSKVPTTAPALKTPAATAPKEEEEKEVQEDDQLETTQALMGELDHRLEALRS